MMRADLMAAFDEGLRALAAGERLEAVLARYPKLSAELRPLLEAAQAARALGENTAIPHSPEMSSRARFLARAGDLRAGVAPTPRARLAFARRALTTFITFLAGFLLGTYGVLTASAQSLPGDQLYQFKRTAEQAQILFSPDPRSRLQLEEHFTQERVTEVQRLLAQGRVAQVEFGGMLQSRDGERWLIEGLTVIVPAGVPVLGVPFPGLFVEVHGTSQIDGTVLASQVEVEGIEFDGVIQAMDAHRWQIGGYTVAVDQYTLISDDLRVGDRVEVHTRLLPSGQMLALQINLLSAGPRPTAAFTDSPAPSATPAPGVRLTEDESETPEPAGTPESTKIGDGENDISTSEASGTPQPSGTPESDDDHGGSGPSPSNTPQP